MYRIDRIKRQLDKKRLNIPFILFTLSIYAIVCIQAWDFQN